MNIKKSIDTVFRKLDLRQILKGMVEYKEKIAEHLFFGGRREESEGFTLNGNFVDS